MKKLLAVLFSFTFVFMLSGCSSDTQSSTSKNESSKVDDRSPETEALTEAKTEAQTEAVTEASTEAVKTEYAVGDTWTVDGQWSLTVNSIEEMAERNEYSDKTPAAVYLVSFTYQNIGYEDSSGFMEGLYFSMDDTIVDSEGTMAYTYPNDFTYPQQTPVGATCNAQACIGVDHPGAVKIHITKYDGNEKKQQAVFTLQP